MGELAAEIANATGLSAQLSAALEALLHANATMIQSVLSATDRGDDPIIDAVGIEGLLCLAIRRGGARMWVPSPAARIEHCALEEMLGTVGADKLRAMFGGGTVDVPSIHAVVRRFRDADVIDRLRNGETVGEVAAAVGMTERHVYRIARRMRLKRKADRCQVDDRQPGRDT